MIKQGTEQWLTEKLGVITGTRAYDLVNSATTRRTLLATLVRELILASGKDDYKSRRMEDSLEIEPEQVSYYSIMNGVVVTDTDAYIESDIHPMFACSPDGLVGEDGGFEGKRLLEENHLKLMLGAPPEKKYVYQCHWNMWICERKWWDLFYYCETLPDELRSHTVRFDRDEAIIADFEKWAGKLLNQLVSFLEGHGLGGLIN